MNATTKTQKLAQLYHEDISYLLKKANSPDQREAYFAKKSVEKMMARMDQLDATNSPGLLAAYAELV